MKIDDSFKKPGSVPFKWEIRPGVPKLQSGSEKHYNQRKQKQPQPDPFPQMPRKLKPPPAGLSLHPQMEPHDPTRIRTRTHSIRSSPRTFSARFGLPARARPDIVSSAGCFPSPLAKAKNVKGGSNTRSVPEPDYYSDLEVSSSRRWSFSSRKSVSPLPPSARSSPRPIREGEWAGFGLF